MKTYPTFAKAKIDNPEDNIYYCMDGFIAEHRIIPFEIDQYEKCRPADHCSTVDEFLKAGYRFFDGDVLLSTKSGNVYYVGVGISEGMANHKGNASCSVVLRAATLNGGSKIPESMGDDESIELNQRAINERRSLKVGTLTYDIKRTVNGEPFNPFSSDELPQGEIVSGDNELDEATQWNGEGLPPAGVECLMVTNVNGKSHEKNIVPIYIDAKVVFYNHSGDHYGFSTIDNRVTFRPLKTTEQVEREDLTRDIYTEWHGGYANTPEWSELTWMEQCRWLAVADFAINRIKGE